MMSHIAAMEARYRHKPKPAKPESRRLRSRTHYLGYDLGRQIRISEIREALRASDRQLGPSGKATDAI
jgi:hypothetical protein